MEPLKARVRNGRLVVLPEGEVVYLKLLDDTDDLDDAERAALHRELEASVAEADAGQLIDADAVLAELRSRR